MPIRITHHTWLVDCQTLLRWSGFPLAITLLLNLDRGSVLEVEI